MMILRKLVNKIINIFFKSCLYCKYFDILPYNRVSRCFCIYHEKDVESSDCCVMFKNRRE